MLDNERIKDGISIFDTHFGYYLRRGEYLLRVNWESTTRDDDLVTLFHRCFRQSIYELDVHRLYYLGDVPMFIINVKQEGLERCGS